MSTRLTTWGTCTRLTNGQTAGVAWQSTVKNDFGWGSPKFHKMGRDKIRLIRDFTMVGLDVLISDIDVVWLENPLPYFARYPNADMLVSTGAYLSERRLVE